MTEAELVPVTDIIVGNRTRKDMRHVAALAESVRRLGLLHPVVINSRNELVAGGRRLEAVKRLGWSDVPARRVDGLDDGIAALLAERDENTCRESLTPTEMAELGKRLEALEKPKADERRQSTLKQNADEDRGGKFPPRDNPQESKGKTREKVADALGVSGRTYAKLKEVADAAEEDPDLYADVVEEMDATGKIDPAHKEVKKRKAGSVKRDPLKDALGEEVPSALRDLFGDVWLGESADQVGESLVVVRKVRRLTEKKSGAYGSFLKTETILKALAAAQIELETAQAMLSEGRPHAVCPDCGGKKCETCRKAGWLPKYRYMELKSEGKL